MKSPAQTFREACKHPPRRSALVTDEWMQRQEEIRQCALRQDPATFFSWPPVKRSMLISAKRTRAEMRFLMRHPRWRSYWHEMYAKNPRECSEEGTYTRHVALLAWLDLLGKLRASDFDLIFEFGGGYGSMCRIAHKAGFKGLYVIFDLPVISALQTYYLTLKKLRVISVDRALKETAPYGVVSVTTMRDLKKLLVYCDVESAMFIATWSLGEAPLSIRAEILPFVAEMKAYLLTYFPKVRDLDNEAYFDETFREACGNVAWVGRQMNRSLWLAGVRQYSD